MSELEKSIIIAMINSMLKDKMIDEKRYCNMIKEVNKDYKSNNLKN